MLYQVSTPLYFCCDGDLVHPRRCRKNCTVAAEALVGLCVHWIVYDPCLSMKNLRVMQLDLCRRL